MLVELIPLPAQLFRKKPIFRGGNTNSELEQLDVIGRVCETPAPKNWPNIIKTKLFTRFNPKKVCPRQLRKNFQE